MKVIKLEGDKSDNDMINFVLRKLSNNHYLINPKKPLQLQSVAAKHYRNRMTTIVVENVV